MIKLALSILLGNFFSAPASALPMPSAVDFAKPKLESAIRRSLPLELRFEIEKIHVPANVPPTAKVYGLGPVPPVGPVSFQFTWEEKGKVRSVRGNATVRAYGKVTVSKAPLRHGELLSAKNTGLEEREISPYLMTGYFTDQKQTVGREALGMLRPGTVLGSSNTRFPKLVVSGQMVDMVHRKGSLKISAKMRAIEAGDLGQWIRVQNLKSSKVVQARVSAKGEVTVQ